MEKTLKSLDENWNGNEKDFEFTKHKDTDVMLIKLSEDNFTTLEEN